MAGLIVSLIPEHHLYCEPFFGGGAVFFTKPPSKVEVINDLNGDVVNFYRTVQQDFGILRTLIISTPHSRQVHREAWQALKFPDTASSVKRAWAFWVQCNMSFSRIMFGGWAYERKSNCSSQNIHNKRLQFTKRIRERLNLVQIDCIDAVAVIKSRDYEDAFFYCDPPYFNSDCGRYKGYTEEDFIMLLDTLTSIKGKFLLSSYQSDILAKYAEAYGWQQHTIIKKVAVNYKINKSKTEVLTGNYDLQSLMKK